MRRDAAAGRRHAAAVRRAAVLVLWAAGGSACLAPTARPGTAQEVVREVQVPLAPERGVVEIDADLRRELGLFPDARGFVTARLFEAEDGRAVLELTLREEGRTVRERRTLPAGELAALRDQIAQGLAGRGMSRVFSRSGRGGLVIAETVLGLGYYGWAVPEALDIDSSRGQVAAYLLTAGASFLVPYHLTRSITVTEAHRDAVVWGGTRGILYGVLVGDALTLGDDHDVSFGNDVSLGEDDDQDIILGLGVLASVAGSVLGYQAVDPARHDQGDVALWSTGGDFALAYGWGTAVALGLYDGETVCHGDVCSTQELESTTAGHLTTVGLGLAGLYGARKWSEVEDYTVGDARALLSFGLLGGQAVLPLAWGLFEDVDNGEKGFAASLVAGSAGGLWLGNRVLRERSLTPGEGLLVQAGHLAGGLLAGGLTYLLDGGDTADELVYMTTTAVGSAAGAILTFRAVSSEDGTRPDGPGGGPGRLARPGRPGGVTVEVDGTGLWAPFFALNAGLAQNAGLARDAGPPARFPVLTIRH